ncbi:lytic murein transglycosylase B [Aquabacterium lacunae]|nr:lytic murein transglycosylase B [Aquabacterium lacunae]
MPGPCRALSLSSPHDTPTLMRLSCLGLAALVLTLGGCTSLIRRSSADAPAPVVERSVPMPPQSAASAATRSTADSTPQGPALIRLPAYPLPVNPEPGSYALHPRSQALALKLAREQGLDPEWTVSVLSQARFIEQVQKLNMPASNPGSKNWQAYRARFIEPIRLRAGAQFVKEHEATLQKAEARWGVPVDIIAGVIGVETIYGRYTGNMRVLDVLTTLSLDFPTGRSDRSPFFQNELGQFLRLCAEQHFDPMTVQGSFAGAIGLPQFMPSSIRAYAVDFDGDGVIDLRNSPADAIGSVANYLARHGWQRGMPTHYLVAPPTDLDQRQTLLGPDIKPTFSSEEMARLGAVLDEPGKRHSGKLALVLLHNGANEPTYLAGTDNFYSITRYNQSSYYALAVIELGRVLSLNAKARNN